MSTSASVGETLTHQKKLLGRHVSAETAAPPSLPRDFDGTRVELWKDFSFQLKAYLEMLEPDFANCMNFAASSQQPLTDKCYVRGLEGTLLDEARWVRMSQQLRYFLILLCSGPPLRIIQSADTQNGFELWRLLNRRYTVEPLVRQHGAPGRILKSSLSEIHFPDATARLDPETWS